MVASRIDKAQSLMKSDGYLRLAAEWSVKARRDLVWCATGWEGTEGAGLRADTGVGIISGRGR